MTPERIAELRYWADSEIYAINEGADPDMLGEALDEVERLQKALEEIEE